MPARRRKPKASSNSRGRRRARDWRYLRDDKLLNLRFRDLDLKVEGTWLEARVEQLHAELAARNIPFRPHVWLSSEWFAADGVPGIAIPFYLAHPRLLRLERRQMLEVEGGSDEWCMRILRHEAGHAIDHAYRLHFKPSWREVFGRYTEPYPDSYQPRPYSKSYVLHLDMWYAQAHPAEDFAETFAVWLTPGSLWQQRYQGWPALRKLEYVDELMSRIAGRKPLVRARRAVDTLGSLSLTLREHYRDKRMRYAKEWPNFYDRDLRRLFSADERFAGNIPAATFLRQNRAALRRVVARWTGAYQYTIDKVLIDMINRSRELKLRLAVSQRRARVEALMLLAVQTMNYLHEGHHRVAL